MKHNFTTDKLLPRLIPVLLIDDRDLIKTTKFSNPRYIGDPINTIKLFNEMEVDELSILDISSSKRSVEPDYDLIGELTENAFMPVSYGGGIKNIEQVTNLFALGIEKIIVNSAVLGSTQLISTAAEMFGRQSVVAAIDVKKNFLGKYKVYDHVKKRNTDHDLFNHVQDLVSAGIGELFVYNVDEDGKMSGFDVNLIESIQKISTVPTIFCGGAGNLIDVKSAINAGADAVAAGSIFIYKSAAKGVLINYPRATELESILLDQN